MADETENAETEETEAEAPAEDVVEETAPEVLPQQLAHPRRGGQRQAHRLAQLLAQGAIRRAQPKFLGERVPDAGFRHPQSLAWGRQ